MLQEGGVLATQRSWVRASVWAKSGGSGTSSVLSFTEPHITRQAYAKVKDWSPRNDSEFEPTVASHITVYLQHTKKERAGLSPAQGMTNLLILVI